MKTTTMMLTMALGMGSGCLVEKTCNLMYAPDMLTLELSNAPLSDSGVTSFLVESDDGEVITCTLDTPEATEGTCGDAEVSSVVREGSAVTLSLWEFAPDSAELTVLNDDVEQGTWSVTPEYTEDEPNGEDCGFRRSAVESMDLSTEE